MTVREARVLHDLVKDGCVFQVRGPYLDSFATIQENDAGVLMIESQVYSPTPAISWTVDSISLYRPVNFREAIQQQPCDGAVMKECR